MHTCNVYETLSVLCGTSGFGNAVFACCCRQATLILIKTKLVRAGRWYGSVNLVIKPGL